MATLKQLVNETTNIKDELKTCHTNLKNSLIAKGVECSDTDKMSSLIDKVKNIKTLSFNVGETTTLYNNTETEMIKCDRIWCRQGQDAGATRKTKLLQATMASKHQTYFQHV